MVPRIIWNTTVWPVAALWKLAAGGRRGQQQQQQQQPPGHSAGAQQLNLRVQLRPHAEFGGAAGGDSSSGAWYVVRLRAGAPRTIAALRDAVRAKLSLPHGCGVDVLDTASRMVLTDDEDVGALEDGATLEVAVAEEHEKSA
jgi:hypothetical protein